MPENYTVMVSIILFAAIGILGDYIEKKHSTSQLPTGTYETSLDTSPTPKSLSLRYKQINRTKNEVDGQPWSLLACM